MRTLLAAAMVAVAWLGTGCDVGSPDPPETVDEPDPGPAPEPEPSPEPERDREVRPEPEPARFVWVGVEGDDRTVMVDLDAGEIVDDLATPGGPHNVTVAPDGTAAATLYTGSDLAIIADGEAGIITLGDRPHDVKANDHGFVVANEAGRRLDLVSLDGEQGPSVDLRGEPHDLAIDPAGTQAWVSLNGTDELAVVDLDTVAVDRYVSTGHAPHDLLFTPDGRLWVTDWTGLLLVLDGDEVTHTRELGVEAHHLAFTPDGGEVWITDHGTNALFVLDAATIEVLEVLALPGAPHHIAITSDGARAAVADHTNGQLLVYDVPTREQIDSIDTGPGPHGVWSVPAPS